jgi:putative aldouronate transport system substrate-binding protein
MPFMRDNGFKQPTTYDEFITYLRWIKNNDANGNGDTTDEIPFTWYGGGLWNVIAFFAHNYMPWVPGGIARVNGTVTAQYRQNEFRNTIRMISDLYREGIIVPDAFTMTHEDLQGMQDGSIPVMAVTGGDWVPAQRGNARFVEHHILQPLRAQNGQIYGTNQPPSSLANVSMVITDKCKNPELAIALYDYLIGWENQEFLHDGPKGYIWNDPDPGTLSYLGTPALFKVDDRARQLNAGWGWVFNYPKQVRYGMQANGIEDAQKWFDTWDPSLRDKLAANPNYPNLFAYVDWSAQAKYPLDEGYFLPILVMSEADNERVSDINATLSAYKDQAVTNFITGTADINRDADWNAYLAQLDGLNDRELIAIYQKYVK